MPIIPAYDYLKKFLPIEVFSQFKADLETISVIELPENLGDFHKIDKKRTIIIYHRSTTYNSLQIIRRGFEHVLSAERADLKKEFLISCLMIIRPASLVENQIPFFFKGLSKDIDWKLAPNLLFLNGSSPRERDLIMDNFTAFLDGSSDLQAISDLALLVADEIVSNSLAQAQTYRSNRNEIKRESNQTSPFQFFAAYDEDQLIIGCIDYYGRINKEHILQHLLKSFSRDMVEPKLGAGGSGIGLKLSLENSANFYLFCENSKKTVVCFGLLLKGKKANTTALKHMHFLFE